MQDKSKAAAAAAQRPPQVDKVLRHPLLEEEQKRIARQHLAELTRRELACMRLEDGADLSDVDAVARRVVERARALARGGIRRVINGTGVILNTNLGRAPLAGEIVERLSNVLAGYCSLEFDLASGKRGERTEVLEELLSVLIGSEAVVVVNNNAAAVMLAVSALAHDKEVVVSRGELIEIGGSFRLPDVIVAAGGILHEVGSTNRTRAGDYKAAIGSKTGILLRCHRSNFEITGFTEQPTLPEVVKVAVDAGVPLVEDLGSGAILEMGPLGLRDEPTVSAVLLSGADLVLFSGDKLLGGVQAGIVVGKRALVERLRKHPIYRALRADKLIIATLEGVFAQYLAPSPQTIVPALRMAITTSECLKQRAQNFAAATKLRTLRCGVVETTSTFGGGTLPGEQLPSYGVEIMPEAKITADKLSRMLRSAENPVVAIVKEGKVTIDFRTVQAEEEPLLATVLTDIDKTL
jgi:L-seryl-tRNA(Ser) seleniumtransferase